MEDIRKLQLTTKIPVRWGDLDRYGHLNNTLYFRYFEQARIEWIEQKDFRVDPDEAEGAVIVHADCTFLIPVNYPATAIVKVFAGQPGRSSVMNWYELYVEGDERLFATGSAKIVWIDNRSGKSLSLPSKLREGL
ncbi:acyl-CoA thioesterase [Aromatoleum aromaticum]|uniref:Predicted thioesterase n=1 Tax=Aromatoleum aromaticum (strain DSM 19018 / LMG 30748 / EbN1) TaxID=76114 RepID=Q5NZ73_AROAE|nr:thioesterase family protein [Aromatoleum aromaticum]NMG54052.1 acyl-CoA thioesterase [Aromatoleum aromaticum]CAI09641.1 predicted thioesterase [Aromatoleum aromaticum EbN1]